MDNCYSADHIAEDHKHTDITCNIENHNRSAALERSVIDYILLWGGFKLVFLSQPSLLASAVVWKYKTSHL